MSLEILEMNANGVGWVSLENASIENKIALEWAILNNAEMKVLCHICHIEIPSGTGNACAKHKQANLRTCQICELAHEGLYCSNCFTGERVRVGKTKFAKVIKLNDITKKGNN